MANIVVELLFLFLYTVHTGAWIFILLGGFVNKQYANWIVFFIVPFMYVLQMFKDHPFEALKTKLLKDEKQKRENVYAPMFILPVLQRKLTNTFFKESIFNPVSYQGLMILAMIINTNLIQLSLKKQK
jgi:hypothetical protein